MTNIKSLIKKYKDFQRNEFLNKKKTGKYLKQSPRALIISCCDSRVDPALITKANLGEIFVIRNIANIVPPYKKMKTFEATSAALEFAIHGLKIRNIVVIGHSGCAGIKTLLESKKTGAINHWVNIAINAKKIAKKNHNKKNQKTSLQELCEKENIKLSLQNLLTYPWIEKNTKQKKIKIFGWYFSLANGTILEFDKKKSDFIKI